MSGTGNSVLMRPWPAAINEIFARTFFPHEDPLGKLATVWYGSAVIVGVVADFKLNELDRMPYPEIFRSIRQTTIAAAIVVHASTSPTKYCRKHRHTSPGLLGFG